MENLVKDLALTASLQPSEIWVDLDLGYVKGGCNLIFNPGNYAGMFELSVQDKVSLLVYGILTIKQPDGTGQFSFKVFGSAQFPPGVQLGLGFVLSGVGLALALECTLKEEAIRESAYNGSLDALLFPANPIQNAPRIINDLGRFFPPKSGCYIIGMMAKLGWGTGVPLVHAELGIFLEFGKTVRLMLAGIAHSELPNEDLPLVVLKLQVLGILNFSDKYVAIDATLKDSRLLEWSLDGDIALRSSWGDNPSFAMSCGGFYPGYRRPAGFPELSRLSVTLGTGNPRIGLLAYLATTENSVQCGAQLMFYWHKHMKIVGHIEVEGGMGFDALLSFNPFYFETVIGAWLTLKRNGDCWMEIDVQLNLNGPNNFHARGYGSVKICRIRVDVEFDEEFGNKKPELKQGVVSPKDALIRELLDRRNWSPSLPDWGGEGVLLREGDDTVNYIDPLGGLCFCQRSIPFCTNLEKYGQAAIPADETYFDLVGNGTTEPMEDFFPPGQFLKLNDEQKISSPAFDKMKSGILFSSKDIAFNASRQDREIVCENKIYKIIDMANSEGEFEQLVEMPFSSLTPTATRKAQNYLAKRIHSRAIRRRDIAMKNTVIVEEQKFALAGSEGSEDKFKSLPVAGLGAAQTTGYLNYAQARQLKLEAENKDVEIFDSSKVSII